MLILEHDAKTLLAADGVPVPQGILTSVREPQAPGFSPPWVVKSQVPVGGRGKAGGIRIVQTRTELDHACAEMADLRIKGYPVREIRIEALIPDAEELYLGLLIEPATAMVQVLVSPHGGVDVETQEAGTMHARRAPPDKEALVTAITEIAADLPPHAATAVIEAGTRMIEAFLAHEALLIEINPLFLRPDGSWVAGDVRMDIDENALLRQPRLTALLGTRPGAYPEAAFKRDHGYDLVVLDPDGEIGLVATGAGLSMQLADEMCNRGLKPYNFCDIRSGGMKGDPRRLIENFETVLKGPNIRCVLVNIFAGITELGEFAETLVNALNSRSSLPVPIIVRLIGNGQDRADEILRASGLPVILERDLDNALALCAAPGGAAC